MSLHLGLLLVYLLAFDFQAESRNGLRRLIKPGTKHKRNDRKLLPPHRLDSTPTANTRAALQPSCLNIKFNLFFISPDARMGVTLPPISIPARLLIVLLYNNLNTISQFTIAVGAGPCEKSLALSFAQSFSNANWALKKSSPFPDRSCGESFSTEFAFLQHSWAE